MTSDRMPAVGRSGPIAIMGPTTSCCGGGQICGRTSNVGLCSGVQLPAHETLATGTATGTRALASATVAPNGTHQTHKEMMYFA